MLRRLRNRVDTSTPVLVVEGLVTLLVTALGGLWAVVQGAGYWLPVVLVLLVGGTLWSIEKFNAVVEIRRGDDEWITAIMRWGHLNRHWQLLETKNLPDGFIMRFKLDEHRTLTVLREQVPLLQFGMSVRPGEADVAALRSVSAIQRQRLYSELIVALAQCGSEIKVESEQFDVTRVAVAHALPLDNSLTEYRFAEATGVVQRAQMAASALISQAAREASISSESDPDTSEGQQ